MSASATESTTQLLDSEALLQLGGLDLVARNVVDGAMSGLHRSSHKGGCSEFTEHREYAPGDDLRLIDWRIVARSDRYCVKQFRDETNLHAWMLLDTSGSMNFGRSTVSRFDFARMACACLSRLLLKQRDSIGLMFESDGQRTAIRPRPQGDHFQSLLTALNSVTASGDRTLVESIHELVGRIRRRGMVMVFTDCFGDIEELTNALQLLRLRGHDVMVFQILTPEEITFRIGRTTVFENMEGRNHRVQIDAGQIRRRYLARFNNFQLRLAEAMRDVDCELITLRTDQPLGDVLANWLLRRRASNRGNG